MACQSLWKNMGCEVAAQVTVCTTSYEDKLSLNIKCLQDFSFATEMKQKENWGKNC